MPAKITAVSEQKKKCTPFLLDVAVMNPEADFKFAISVEKQCSIDNDPIWKLVFDLDKKNSKGEFIQVVHVSFTASTPQEAKGIENTSVAGLNKKQADVAVKKVHAAAKKVAAGDKNPKTAKTINSGMTEIAVLGNPS
jgi:hypothetical protein